MFQLDNCLEWMDPVSRAAVETGLTEKEHVWLQQAYHAMMKGLRTKGPSVDDLVHLALRRVLSP